MAADNNKEMEIIDETVPLDGYEVVRGEFFAHLYEPSFTFNNNKISVNTACIRKLPDTEYVQILVNPTEKKLAVRPCSESDKDSFRWCTASAKKRSPKQVTCRVFFAKIISLMDWNMGYRYKLVGKLIRSGGELLFIFDLKTPEIFVRTIKEDGTEKSSRTPTYPAEWEHQFGVPVAEHQKALQVNIFDGYAVFSIQDKKTKSKESEGTEHEQPDIFPTEPVH
ncbi:MAG: integrase [Lachnospiraceae bacterium]|nr:integrase [Lachnospiraceae bacterium]